MDDEIKNKLEKDQIKGIPDDIVFSYKPDQLVKGSFPLVVDHVFWLKFCETAEELSTTPTWMLLKIMETFLLTVGKLKPDFKMYEGSAPCDNVVVRLEDIKDVDPKHMFGLGKNYLNRKPREDSDAPKEDEDDPFGLDGL